MNTIQKINWKRLIPALLIPLAVGALAALLTKDAMARFGELRKPPLSPPAWLFPVVWTILYVLMGVSMAIVWRETSGIERKRALRAWALQLAVNFLWPVFFFGLEWRLFAFFWLLLLIVLVVRMTLIFNRHSRLAARLQIPYLVWLAFAGYLNFAVWLLNR
jgi:tryptophan-rich sensory protein